VQNEVLHRRHNWHPTPPLKTADHSVNFTVRKQAVFDKHWCSKTLFNK